ncbi:MAG: hypothetical protein IKI01_09050 [Lachnospiraceae bacterium]|nr:hypothetical protein [Lachnospiraceae bacterium]
MKRTRKLLSICLSLCIFFTCIAWIKVPTAAAAETTPASTTDDPVIIVSLGDSYSSGEGIEDFFGQDLPVNEKVQNSDWLAHRSENAWSGMLTSNGFTGTASTHRNENWYFVAASGAKIEHLLNEQSKSYNYGDETGTKMLDPQLKIFEGLNLTENDFITITIGGNDIGFVNILTNALNPFSSTPIDTIISDALTDFDTNISEKLKSAYKEIEIVSGGATIIVVGYPRLLNNAGFTFKTYVSPFGEVELTVASDTAQKVNKGIDDFNQKISDLVYECSLEGMNIEFVSVVDNFKTFEAYTEGEYINRLITGRQSEDLTGDEHSTSAYSFHPNLKGATAYAAAVQAKINEIEAAKKSFSVLQERIGTVADGGTISLDQDYTALSTDIHLVIPSNKTITIDLNGHTIDRNLSSAKDKGNVIFIEESANLTIIDSGSSSGMITGGNTTGYGGGIYNNGTLNLENCNISGNNATLGGGGIYNNGTLNLQTDNDPNPKPIVISGNTSGSQASNVYLPSRKTITADTSLIAGSQIGVTVEDAPTGVNPVTITNNCDQSTSYFKSDNTDYVFVNDNGVAKLAVPVKVTFDKNDGSGTTKEQIVYGGIKATLNGNPFTLEYHTFSSWNTEALGTGNSYDKDAVVTLTADTVLYAQWTKNKYLVKFVTQNGTELQSGRVEYLDIPVFNGTPTMAPDEQYTYTFEKWSPDIKAVTGEATYTAIFTETTNEYTIKFVNEDGTELQSEKVKYGETPKYKGAKPTKTPDAQYTYTFDEWSPAITTVKGDATYIATYKETTNEYTIKFVNEDGTELQSEKVKYGETPKYNGAVPTKASDAQYTYTFDKWTPVIAEVTGSATYTATYKETLNKYTITFVDEDGTELWASDVEYGVIPVYKGKTPTKASDAQYTYTFDKWSADLAAVTGKATYTATYKATTNKYLISFVDEDGTVLQSSEVAYGEIPEYSGKTPAKAPDSNYTYTFDKWTPEIAKVTGAATYTAIYTSKVNEHVPGEKKIENEKKPTCTEDGSYDEVIYCETCKEEIYRKTITVAATGHEFGDWKVVKEPTITEKGMEQRVCAKDASHIETREIEKLPKMVYASVSNTLNWRKGNGNALTFTIHRAEDDKNCFRHYVQTLIDGKKAEVEAKSGSTIITISAAELEKLSVGEHFITVHFDDGEVTFSMLISAATTSPESPTTGDNSQPVLWYLLTICSLAGLAGFTLYGRKHAAK